MIGREAFRETRISKFIAPETLRTIEEGAFKSCWNLKLVVLNEGLETLEYIFSECGVEELTLPSTLKNISNSVFNDCYSCKYLQIIWTAENFSINIRPIVKDSVPILSKSMRIGDKLLLDLRGTKDVSIPEGVESIGQYWFYNSDVESVVIPISVKIIKNEAFFKCQ